MSGAPRASEGSPKSALAWPPGVKDTTSAAYSHEVPSVTHWFIARIAGTATSSRDKHADDGEATARLLNIFIIPFLRSVPRSVPPVSGAGQGGNSSRSASAPGARMV